MVSIDPYLNETTRHADVILPPTAQLERSRYELLLTIVSVRNWAKYSPAVFPRGADQRHDWEICLELSGRLLGPDTRLTRLLGRLGRDGRARLRAGGPDRARAAHRPLRPAQAARRLVAAHTAP